jgi:hypothetical protein
MRLEGFSYNPRRGRPVYFPSTQQCYIPAGVKTVLRNRIGPELSHPCCREGVMPNDPNIHRRRSIRLKGFDYLQPGADFVMIATHEKESFSCRVIAGNVFPLPSPILKSQN